MKQEKDAKYISPRTSSKTVKLANIIKDLRQSSKLHNDKSLKIINKNNSINFNNQSNYSNLL